MSGLIVLSGLIRELAGLCALSAAAELLLVKDEDGFSFQSVCRLAVLATLIRALAGLLG